MAYRNDFKRQLDDVWRRRTAELCRLVVQGKGKPKTLNRAAFNRCVENLQDIAAQILYKRHARRDLRRITKYSSKNRISRREANNTDHLLHWARNRAQGPAIYSFWSGQTCLYVGKAQSLTSRLRSYIQSRSQYLGTGKTIKVFGIVGRSHLPQAECLYIHRFNPLANRKSPSQTKWGKKCPICRVRRQIKNELQRALHVK